MAHYTTFSKTWQAYLLLVPTVLGMLVFLYYPTLDTFRLSLYNTFLFEAKDFIGLENYQTLLTSPSYHYSIIISIVLAGIIVVGTISISLVLSLALYKVSRYKNTYIVLSIWPYAVPTAVAGMTFLFLAHPDIGIYSHVIESLFGVRLEWFTNGWQALLVIAGASIWKQLGFNIIFMFAAFQQIPESLIESAKLDGIGSFKLLGWVYVPLISPTLIFLMVMNTIYAFFGSFAFVDLMTGGGPDQQTNILIYKLYQDAFSYGNLGSASAQSVILFVLVAVLTIIQLRISDRYAHYGA